MTSSITQPVFQRISADEKNTYNLFFTSTDDDRIQSYARGASLNKLVTLAETTYSLVIKINPLLQEGSPQSAAIPGRQWELDYLSEIKLRLAKAIDCKRDYYENHWFGKITKYVLKCLSKWNNANTASIVRAEEFLMMYDSRLPLFKSADGNYQSKCFFPLTHASWVRDNLDTSRFFNYNPRRSIPIVQSFRYDTLDHRHPQIIIRT